MSVASVPMDEVYKPTYQYEIYDSGHKINLSNTNLLVEPILNGYIAHLIQQHKYRKYRDKSLWEEFVEHFDKWTKETFEVLS
ncbi:hypothetical protein OnM2_101041, partial [Erysiphe neolycopersici]